jgi:uracil-DNA glycosylase
VAYGPEAKQVRKSEPKPDGKSEPKPDGKSEPKPDGSLRRWAEQGVLLLNSCWTVEDGLPASHANWGWEALTCAVLQAVASRGLPCVWMLWGAHAQRLLPESVGADALVLRANHPSPLAARRPPVPFVGCAHFSQAQAYWAQRGVSLYF